MFRAVAAGRLFINSSKYEKYLHDLTESLRRRFWQTSSTLQLKLDSNNVFSSPFRDVADFENMYLHDVVWENVDRWADKTAAICSVTGRSYTYREARKLSGKLAMSFRKNKLLPGDTIALISPNVPEYAIIALAASEAGLRLCLLNSNYTVEELKKLIDKMNISAFVTVPSLYANIKKCIENYTAVRYPIILINDGMGELHSDAIKLDEWMKSDIEEFCKTEKTRIDYNEAVLLPFSSGTTGLPKAVELTHRNLAANTKQFVSKDLLDAEEAVGDYQEIIPLKLPLFHIYGLMVCMFSQMRIGAKLICIPKFNLPDFLNALKQYRPTQLYTIPPVIQMMANNKAVTSDHVQSIRIITSGAAPLGKESISLFKQNVSSKPVFVQGYGMTETSPMVSYSKNAASESVGYIVPNTQARIVKCTDENSCENLGVGGIGELYVRGPQVMKGYYNNPKATSETLDGEWLKTGDLASFNEEGLMYIQGRLKELIKVKGFQVPPAELEEVLRTLEKVEDVAVVGVEHKQYGEIPKAFIVPKKGVTIHEDEVKQFVAQRVAKYKQLGYVRFIDKIPKTASGKILRKELK